MKYTDILLGIGLVTAAIIGYEIYNYYAASNAPHINDTAISGSSDVASLPTVQTPTVQTPIPDNIITWGPMPQPSPTTDKQVSVASTVKNAPQTEPKLTFPAYSPKEPLLPNGQPNYLAMAGSSY